MTARRDGWSRWQTILATILAGCGIMAAGIKAGSLVFATKSDIDEIRLQLTGQSAKLNLLLMAYPIHNERGQAARKKGE